MQSHTFWCDSVQQRARSSPIVSRAMSRCSLAPSIRLVVPRRSPSPSLTSHPLVLLPCAFDLLTASLRHFQHSSQFSHHSDRFSPKPLPARQYRLIGGVWSSTLIEQLRRAEIARHQLDRLIRPPASSATVSLFLSHDRCCPETTGHHRRSHLDGLRQNLLPRLAPLANRAQTLEPPGTHPSFQHV